MSERQFAPVDTEQDYSPPTNSEFVSTPELRQKIEQWRKDNPDAPVVIEIGSRSNNNDGAILQSSQPDVKGDPILVIHVDPLNQPTDRIPDAPPSSHAFIVRDRFDADIGRQLRGQVDLAVVVGLIPDENIENEILEGIKRLAPPYVYISSDADSGDRQVTGYTVAQTRKNITRILGNEYSAEDPILPADVRPNSSIVTQGRSLSMTLERD